MCFLSHLSLLVSSYMCIQLGRTALMYSVLGRRLEITKYLCQSGADITISDIVRNKTALKASFSILYSRPSCLLQNECTAQQIAEQEGCVDIHTYLRGRSSKRPTEMVSGSYYRHMKWRTSYFGSRSTSCTVKITWRYVIPKGCFAYIL